MTGPGHYTSAEQWLYKAQHEGARGDAETAESCAAIAQVHATLALAAATAMNDGSGGMGAYDWDAWREAASVGWEPADGAK